MKKKHLLTVISFFLGYCAIAQDSTFYFTTTDSVKLYVRVAGRGEPCVFIHGGPGSSSYYLEAMKSAPMIEQHLQMIYFDQRGSGRSSSAANSDYSIARMEKDIEELRSALSINRWNVMAHSFGGFVATSYALHQPKRVSLLMLINCTLNISYSMNSHLEFGLKELNIADQKPYRDTAVALTERVWQVHDSLTKKGVWYKLMFRNAYEKKYNDSISSSIGKWNRDYSNNVWNLQEYWKDFTPITKLIKCPVLVMTGSEDYAVGPEHYKSFHFPHQTTITYFGGHAPFQEEPQWFAEKIITFAQKD